MQDKKPPLRSNFVGQGIILFFDLILVAVTNWLYWLVVSRLTLASEIGQATSVYSLVLLITTLCQLGLEYPILRKSSVDRSQVLGVTLTIELILIPAQIIALIFLAYTNFYHESLSEFLWIAIVLLVLSPISFVARFGLLGLSNARTLLIFDAVSTAAKFFSAYILLSMNLGAFGILFSFMMTTVVGSAAILAIVRRRLPIKLVQNKKYIIEVIKDGLSNAPSKLSRTIIMTLTVILLAPFGISDSDIGIFYIAMMLSIVGASLASSMSFTVIPASTESSVDLSSGSLRLGLTFTSPIVAAFIVSSKYILGIIGPAYTSADIALMVLSIGILPTAITMNAISKFNNLGNGRRIIAIGMIQTLGFLVPFLILVPLRGTLGAAYSILVANTASAIFSVFLFGGPERKYIANCLAAVAIGCIGGYAINFIGGNSLFALISAVAVTSVVLLALRNTSVSELRQLVRSMNKVGTTKAAEKGYPPKDI